MKVKPTRQGGRYVFFERGGREVPVPVEETEPEPATPAATAPLWEHARVQAGALLVMAKICEVSVPEFVRRYV